MESKDELKEIDIKNRTCYHFDDIMRVRDIDYSDILLDEKSYKTYKNILIYDIPYRTFMGSKPLSIRFGEIDEFVKTSYVTRYLVLFGSGLYDTIYNMIRYHMIEKCGITDRINHNIARIRIDSCNSLPIANSDFSLVPYFSLLVFSR